MKYILTTIILISVTILYEKYKQHNVNDEEFKQYQLVKQYLLNDSSLAQSKLPIIWIHMNYEVNSRWWPSFNSRNTKYLNQPYQLLTIKSIVDKCGESFNICLIDDNSFSNILPGWNIDLNLIAEPIKNNIRKLALAKLLKSYGGMLVPSSFICIQNLETIYLQGISGKGMFVGELMNRDGKGPEDNEQFCPSEKFMGCTKNCPIMNNYINYLERLISTDFTDESNFVGDGALWCLEEIKKNNMSLIPAEMLGSRDTDGKLITLEMLLGELYIDVYNNAVGIYIPDKDILRRTAYQWFARLSAGQALASNTVIGKYLTLVNN